MAGGCSCTYRRVNAGALQGGLEDSRQHVVRQSILQSAPLCLCTQGLLRTFSHSAVCVCCEHDEDCGP